MRRISGAIVAVLGALVMLGVLAAPAWADSPESIRSYRTAVVVRADGSIQVSESIAYDFGTNERHGIVRDIPTTFHYDDLHNRVYPVDQITVTRDGRSEPVDTSDIDNGISLRIGDPDQTVTGVHQYEIRYVVRGALNHFADHEELSWDVVGTEWTVPIATASATVAGPAGVTRVGCFSGTEGSRLGCAQAAVVDGTADFAQSNLGNGAGMTAVVAFPPGSVATGAPILADRHDPTAAFHVSPTTVGVGAGLAVLGIAAAVFLAWQHGRDRRFVGLLPGLSPEPGETAVEERKPLRGGPPVSVEFGPPDGLRPAQVGTLYDEKADVVDVTATIVDLAVRKFLHIGQLDDDWELTKLDPPARPKGGALLPYEDQLYGALFEGRDTVRLSELRGTFAGDLAQTQQALYDDVVQRGWYRRSPATTRQVARLLGVVGLLVAIGITVFLGLFTHVALIGVGLVIAAIAFLAVAGRFPARTGRGSAVQERIRGFRLYVATAEKDQIAFQERAQIFSEFLPYAMVFGLVEHWAGIFADLDVSGSPELSWFSGNFVAGYTIGAFASSFNGFTTAATGTVATAAASATGASSFGGGGADFSGGGAGGGGGGSW